jgi:carbon-monoxide dehydrogenase small subunit
MSEIRLTVNGATVVADVQPRLHLADFVRETLLLTGTHLGCEHGVCGACTLLIGGAPARSCIAFAAACDGARVETIEGLEHDPVIERLRAAFTAEHALQCGYCTPGMLVTARDIVLRLPRADEARIRLELAGNLCRCTGYAGIVRAITRVLADMPQASAEAVRPPPLPLRDQSDLTYADNPPINALRDEAAGTGGDAEAVTQSVRIAASPDAVWQAVQDPALIASCLPGASLGGQRDGKIEGSLALSLGPMKARFAGRASFGFGAGQTGWLRGEGRDRLSGTRLSADLAFVVRPDGAAASLLDLSVRYRLRGPLAQFARGAVVAAFAAELAETVGSNLAARLAGTAPPPATRLGLGRLLWRTLGRTLGRTLRRTLGGSGRRWLRRG